MSIPHVRTFRNDEPPLLHEMCVALLQTIKETGKEAKRIPALSLGSFEHKKGALQK